MNIADTRRAAALLRLLAGVELARLQDAPEHATRLLEAVDPVEARLLADGLDFEAAIRELHNRPAASVSSRKVW